MQSAFFITFNDLTGILFLFRDYERPLEEVQGIMYKIGRIQEGPYITLIQMLIE